MRRLSSRTPVRFAKVATNVAGNATCASACFLVYAAGAAKFANYTAQVGVHGASDKQGEETVASGAATVSMARAAKELGVPSNLCIPRSAIAIELDGPDFHERTKPQAARDRARERTIVRHGYIIHRFTGSEVYRNPRKCVEEVIQLITLPAR